MTTRVLRAVRERVRAVSRTYDLLFFTLFIIIVIIIIIILLLLLFLFESALPWNTLVSRKGRIS